MDRELLYLTALAIAAIVTSIAIAVGIVNYVGPDGDAGSHLASNEHAALAHNLEIKTTAGHDGPDHYQFTGRRSIRNIGGVYPVFY